MTNQNARKILLVTLEPVAKSMAGPAIRCLELGKQLAKEFSVTLASPVKVAQTDALDLSTDPLASKIKLLSGVNKTALYNEAALCDVLVIQSNVLRPFPKLAEMGKYLVVDLYDPYLFTVLVQYQDKGKSGLASYRLMHNILESHMVACDFSMCASERQRDYWLGRYCGVGRLTPDIYAFDHSLRKLIDLVPFGLQDKAPQRSGPGITGIKGVVPGISESDKVILWGGGIWDWFDPLTVINAIDKIKDKIPNVRLYFMGVKSPNPKVVVMDMANKAMELSQKLKLTNKYVFFEEGWTPYAERVNCLLDADIAVSAHFDLPETRFSFRTRMLDYLWSGLPILTTCGDDLSDLIDQKGAGLSIGYKDVDAMALGMEKILLDENFQTSARQASSKLAQEFTWQRVSEKLVEYCRNPYHLPPFSKVTMPSIIERAQAVYARGGKDLIIKRSKEVIQDIFR